MAKKSIYATKGKQKYIFLELQIRSGEQEFNSSTVHEIKKSKNIDKFADDYSKGFYFEKAKVYDGWHEHIGGTVITRVRRIEEITKEAFDIMKQYI